MVSFLVNLYTIYPQMIITLIITVIEAIIIIPAKTLQKNTLKTESNKIINLEKKYIKVDLEWML